MTDKTNYFENGVHKIRKNLEVENAKQQIELLRRYNAAQTDDESRTIVQMLDKDLLDIFINTPETPSGIIPKLEMAIEKDKFRPRNQSLIWFALNPDLEYINGDFSTAMPGRKVTKQTDQDALRTVLSKTLSNTQNVSKQYASDIIYSLNEILEDHIQSALNGNLYAYETILTTIAQDLTENHGDKNAFVRLEVEVSPDHGPSKTTAGRHLVLTNKKTGVKKHKIIIYLNNIKYMLNKVSKKFAVASPTEQQQMIFTEVIATFAHEFGHVIDRANPNRGALGAQTSHIGEQIYDKSTRKKYLSNPTEVSSHKIEDQTRLGITQWLQHQINR